MLLVAAPYPEPRGPAVKCAARKAGPHAMFSALHMMPRPETFGVVLENNLPQWATVGQ